MTYTYSRVPARQQWEAILAEYGPGHPRVQETRATAEATTRAGLWAALVKTFRSWTPPAYAPDADALARLLGMDPATADMFAAALNEASWTEASYTWHGTLITIQGDGFGLAPALRGPLCEARDHVDSCPHPSCATTADETPWTDECPRGHGWQHVTGAGTGGGFAGGRIYWTTLECDHTVMDESDDVAAPR